MGNGFSAVIALLGLVFGGSGAVLGFAATRPRGRDRHAVAAAAGIVALVVVLAAVGTHSQVDLGNLAAWVSALGAVFTAGGVLLALQSYRSQQRDKLDDQANQARLIRINTIPGPITNEKPTWWMTVHNQSADPVFDIDIRAFRTAAEDGTSIAMRAIERTPIGDTFITASGRTYRRQLDANEKFELLWTAADPDTNVPGAVSQFTLMDAKGRYWLVTDHYEPEKIPKPARPAAEQRKSVGWARS